VKNYVLRVCSLFLITFLFVSNGFAQDRVRKVAIFVFDGVRIDALEQLVSQGKVPFVQQILKNGDIRRGHVGPATSISYSAPGWKTITSFTPDHGMKDNSFTVMRNDRPSFFNLALRQKPDLKTMAMVNWPPIIDSMFEHFNDDDLSYLRSFGHLETKPYSFAADIGVAQATIAEINRRKSSPDILFVGFDGSDYVGEKVGFSKNLSEYNNAIILASDLSMEIVRAIQAQPSYENEDWLFIITTDHSGRLSDKRHVRPSTEFTRRIWVAAAATDVEVELPKVTDAKDVSAIAFKYLGLKPPAYYDGNLKSLKFVSRNRKKLILTPPDSCSKTLKSVSRPKKL